jgi:hypothetical protein
MVARCGLVAERRVLARRGWVCEKSGLFEQSVGLSSVIYLSSALLRTCNSFSIPC